MKRPIPPHGTYARANGSPGYRPACKCHPCQEARRRYDKRGRVNRQLGKSSRINPAAARAHLTLLHETMAWESLAAATGIPVSNLCKIYSGQRKTIYRDTHNKIMAVRPPAQGDPWQNIDATGSIRRVRALCAIGHSYRVIAEAAHSSHTRIAIVATGTQRTIRRGYADRIDRAYQQLATTPAPRNKYTARTRNNAKAHGWRDPLWWEDYGHIDDPDFDPDTVEEPTPRFVAIAEDALELEALGCSRAEAALRLGVSKGALEKSITRYRAAVGRAA